MSGKFNWTAEACEQLTMLWQQGYSCSQIAYKMGLTSRNQVIGKAHRLGLHKLPRNTKPVNGPRVPRPAATISATHSVICSRPASR